MKILLIMENSVRSLIKILRQEISWNIILPYFEGNKINKIHGDVFFISNRCRIVKMAYLWDPF